MPPNILTLDKVGPLSKNFTVHIMVTEKGLAKLTSTSSSSYQRLLLQDAQGNKMQSIIYGDNIEILANKLKLYHTYAISNAIVTKIKEQFRFLNKMHQLVVSAKSPVEEIKIDGFSLRSLQFNFTPLSNINAVEQTDAKIDVLFAVLSVGQRRKPNSSYVVDLEVIDTSMVPTIISLWDQFSQYEAEEFRKTPGPFPIAIGMRLKLSTYCGGSLATRGPSAFIFNPSFPEAIALRKWCMTNTENIKNLQPANQRKAAPKKPAPDDIVSIVDLPTSVTETEYPSIEGTIQVLDFNQNFYYLSCSNCNRATNAYDDDNFWCNYCDIKVPPLPRIKFNVQITDETQSISATIFAEKAEQLYNITAAEMVNNTTDGNLSVEMIQKLSTPKKKTIILRATMYAYGEIDQCVFTIHSIFDTAPADQATAATSSQDLGPNTPKKRGAKPSSTIESPTTAATMEQDAPLEPLKNKQKKD